MKRITILILLLLTAILSLYLWKTWPMFHQTWTEEAINSKEKLKMKKMDEISLILTEKFPDFSLAPTDSDAWSNALVMEQIVGTLVKYGKNGSYEPFLAEKWETTANEQEWKFSLKENLLTDSGQQITAANFVLSIKKMLRIYAEASTPPMFSDLIGWEKFIKGNDQALQIIPIDAKTIVFKFGRVPSGVLEFLSMPYFGFYTETDIDGKNWKNHNTITASGAYRLKHREHRKIQLELRENSILYKNKNAPKIVNILYKHLSEISESDAPAVIQLKSKDIISSESMDFTYRIDTTPTTLKSIIVSPYVKPFDDIELRKAFRDIVRDIVDRIDDSSLNEKKSFHFYNMFRNFKVTRGSLEESKNKMLSLRSSTLDLFKKNNGEIDSNSLLGMVVTEIKKNYDLTIRFIGPDDLGSDWLKVASENKKFPLRLTSVDIGGAPENWLIRMMFGSTLGVSFPDVSGRMMDTVKKYEDSGFQNIEKYWEQVHQNIESDATVIVLGHFGGSWLVTKDIPKTNFNQTMNLPRFDLIELEK